MFFYTNWEQLKMQSNQLKCFNRLNVGTSSHLIGQIFLSLQKVYFFGTTWHAPILFYIIQMCTKINYHYYGLTLYDLKAFLIHYPRWCHKTQGSFTLKNLSNSCNIVIFIFHFRFFFWNISSYKQIGISCEHKRDKIRQM